MKFKAVIGLGFGDEGKGTVVDWLCSQQNNNTLVIRYCGGPQAGHTVTKGKIRHIFANFGSGTLRGVPTYWSKFCPIDPVAIVKEFNILKDKGVTPELYIDYNCPIITPCDIQMNMWDEKIMKNGSCGVGVGTTLRREDEQYHLQYKDLFYPKITKMKFNLIQKYYGYDYERTIRDEDLVYFLKCIEFIIKSENIKREYSIEDFSAYIFEGAQGLLLDQTIGFFPHVTRGNTGTKNILKTIDEKFYLRDPEIDLCLVTRAYQVKHGNGPMTNEEIKNNIMIPPEETNICNDRQGAVRYSLLDLDLLSYAINSDDYIKKSCNKVLIITCMDHIGNDYRFTYNEKIVNCNNQADFLNKIKNILNIKDVFYNVSPEPRTISAI